MRSRMPGLFRSHGIWHLFDAVPGLLAAAVSSRRGQRLVCAKMVDLSLAPAALCPGLRIYAVGDGMAAASTSWLHFTGQSQPIWTRGPLPKAC